MSERTLPRQPCDVIARPAVSAAGFAAARRLGLFLGAKPARAFADSHLDLGIPAAFRGMIDARAGAIHIALDPARRRWRFRAGGRCEQDRHRIRRRLDGAEDAGLLVAD